MGQLKNDLVFLEINPLPWPPLSWRSQKISDPCRSLWGLHPALAAHHTLIHLPQSLLTCQSWERPLGDCRDSLVLACRTPRPKPSGYCPFGLFVWSSPKAVSLGGRMTHRKSKGLETAELSPLGTFRKLSLSLFICQMGIIISTVGVSMGMTL